MKMQRRDFLLLAGSAVAAPAVMRVTRANAAEVTLKLHHFLPAVSNIHKNFLTPWAERVEKDSGGRIKIDIFASMQLGGAPPQLYDQARDGVADIVWTLPGSTPGRFPKIEVFELPFTVGKLGVPNAKAVQEFGEKNLVDEFKDTKIITWWAHDAGVIHATKQVKTMEDMKGLKLRFPTRLTGEALKALGATAVGMPVPQVPEAMAQKVIDGCVVPWEVVPAIKVQELVKYHTEIPGSPTLYAATFVLAMNPAKYNALPADLKAVIDKNSGQVAAEMAGAAWDNAAPGVIDLVKKRGNIITTLSAEETARWQKACDPVVENWLKTAKEKGMDSAKVLEGAKATLAKYVKA